MTLYGDGIFLDRVWTDDRTRWKDLHDFEDFAYSCLIVTRPIIPAEDSNSKELQSSDHEVGFGFGC